MSNSFDYSEPTKGAVYKRVFQQGRVRESILEHKEDFMIAAECRLREKIDRCVFYMIYDRYGILATGAASLPSNNPNWLF